jgi:hypothetical protein
VEGCPRPVAVRGLWEFGPEDGVPLFTRHHHGKQLASQCTAALEKYCAAAKSTGGEDACELCAGEHHKQLVRKGCDTAQIDSYCRN